MSPCPEVCTRRTISDWFCAPCWCSGVTEIPIVFSFSPSQSAELTGDLESVAGIADFRVIDPPRASSRPVAPNRIVLLPLGLLFAIAGGFLVTLAASQLRPVFFDGKSLRDQTGLPVLGIVSLLPNEIRHMQERTSLTRFLLAGAALVTVYAVGIAVLTYLSERAA